MKNLTLKFEKLNALKVEQHQAMSALQGLRFSDKKGSEEYKHYQTLKGQVETLQKEIETDQLSNRIETVNAFHTKVNGLLEKVKTYEGNFVKSDGSSTKKFKDFCASIGAGIDDEVTIYANKKYTHLSESIIFSGKQGLREEINVDSLAGFMPFALYDFDTVIEARKKHNELLKEFERIKSELNANYRTATADGELHHYGQNYTFD